MASPSAVTLDMTRDQARPTLLQGPGKSADANAGPEIPKLRFSHELGEDGCNSASVGLTGSGSFAPDGEFPKEYRLSECLRLKEVAEHYKMGKQLGEGGYGKVFQVKCKKTRKNFALKEVVIPADHTIDDIEAEVAHSSEFDHPYILKLHAFFRDGRNYHLVFDLCSGGNLAEYVEQYGQAVRQVIRDFRSGLPNKTVKRIVPQMLSGLLYLHHYGFVHRDIKPHNYLRVSNDSDTVKLCDFGMCVRIGPNETLSKVCGTTGFLAPEMRFEKCYDQKADVFSLGITVFAIANDAVPREEENAIDYTKSLQTTLLEARSWQEGSPELSALVCQLLAIEPKIRPTIKEAISDADWIQKALQKKGQSQMCNVCSVM